MNNRNFLISYSFAFLLIFTLSATASCTTNSAEAPQTEAQALETLRSITRNGNLPSETVVAAIESRFPNTKTAALARLLRAHILSQNNDANGAANLLDTNLIREKTAVGDYALSLRGNALLKANKNADASRVFELLIKDFPDSSRVRDAKLNLARIRLQNSENERVTSVLQELLDKNDGAAWLIIAQMNEKNGRQSEAVAAYRRIYFFAPASAELREAENSLKRLAFDFNSATNDENLNRADALFKAGRFIEAATLYQKLAANPSFNLLPQQQFQRGMALSNSKKYAESVAAFNAIPISAGNLKKTALFESAKANANARNYVGARASIEDLRRGFANDAIVPKAFVAVGMIARDQKNRLEEANFMRTALNNYPNAVDVGQAQFELAWLEHENGSVQNSSQMLIDHLARYAAKDTTYRGRAGYWAARDSERAGKLPEACALYEAMSARYDANWYGYLANSRFDALKKSNRCSAANNPPNETVKQAVANLKTVTVAPETAGDKERIIIEKSNQLATVALFDWALSELETAQKTAPNSPQVNLGLAKYYRLRGDNVSGLLALAKSYPDYSQMKPEELGAEEWDIFYPLTNWETIKNWANNRRLDKYQVAGFIRQESVFNPRAKSSANAYGLMQLLLPTARSTARKYGAASPNSAEDLYNPALNIELGTAFIRDNYDKFGRVEYVAVAYNAGPGRVPQWQNSLPLEIDEFVEAIPFKETKGYVQGIIRNSAQYRRLYDENGRFKANVGTKPLRGEIDSKSREQFAAEFPDIKLDTSENGE